MVDFLGIPGSDSWLRTELVDRGWSGDTKYRVWTRDGNQLLLRVSDISMTDRKRSEYEAMRMLDSCDVLMSRPVDWGVCDGDQCVFVLLTWLDGEDAECVLPKLSAKEQYALGYSAGKALRKIHGLSAPAGQEDWAPRFSRKTDRRIQDYEECAITIEGAERMISFVDGNRSLLVGRKQTFQHGDYHVGNMVITEESRVGILDFNRYDYGDPWEEFNRICWCVGVSTHFASGRINGYFEGAPPDSFFRLMALYIASNTLGSVAWAVSFGDTEVRTMLGQARSVLDWYDGFRTHVPRWYMDSCEG